jgi:hypothetical protein
MINFDELLSRDENLEKFGRQIEKRLSKKKNVSANKRNDFITNAKKLIKFENELKEDLYDWNQHLDQETVKHAEGYDIDHKKFFSEYETDINSKIEEKNAFMTSFKKFNDYLDEL